MEIELGGKYLTRIHVHTHRHTHLIRAVSLKV